jgi:hypothetical protein
MVTRRKRIPWCSKNTLVRLREAAILGHVNPCLGHVHPRSMQTAARVLVVSADRRLSYRSTDPLSAADWISEDVSFPEPQNYPSGSLKRVFLALVPENVVTNLRYPISRVGTALQLQLASLPTSSMPKVAVTENNHTTLRNNQIWPTGEAGDIDVKIEAYSF